MGGWRKGRAGFAAGLVAAASVGAAVGVVGGAVLTHLLAWPPLWDCIGPENMYLWVFGGVGFVSGGEGTALGFAVARILNPPAATPS